MQLPSALLILSTLLLTSCSEVEPAEYTYVLPYSAFGPPSMSGSLLGVEWYQWQPHGDSRPKQYPVKVVVYRELAKSEVEKAFPVNPAEELDYRYVSYSAAISYLDKNIKDVEAMEQEGFPMGRLAEELNTTKALIQSNLSR
ncbi:hypothetical protein ACFSJ3_03055 [Corallincola platygyrae]|uniref:Uncharacterized protein n=1 Tax=Corallincola platygyrae TaxID=1193278 RepID=A0ABW4XJT9_9GAMM